MTDTTTLVPFHNDQIVVVERDHQPFVAIRPVCERLGVDGKSQRRKITDPENDWNWGLMTPVGASRDGKAREMVCLALSDFPLWLASISPSRVAEPHREALRLYRKEAAGVLYAHFVGDRQVLAEQHALAVDALIAAHPVYARVRAAQHAGTPRTEVRHVIGRSREATETLLHMLERIGVIDPDGWAAWDAVHHRWLGLRGNYEGRAFADVRAAHTELTAVLNAADADVAWEAGS